MLNINNDHITKIEIPAEEMIGDTIPVVPPKEITIEELQELHRIFVSLYDRGLVGISSDCVQVSCEVFKKLTEVNQITTKYIGGNYIGGNYIELSTIIDGLEIKALV